MPSQNKNPLETLQHLLLDLHKTLLEYQRKKYEHLHGKIPTAGAYLELVIHNSEFAWLRALSGLIAAIDEFGETEEVADVERVANLLHSTTNLLAPNESGDPFARNYHVALQEESSVTHAHGRVMLEIKKIAAV